MKGSMSNHFCDYLDRERSAVHLFSEFITNLKISSSNQETDIDRQPEDTHQTIIESIEDSESYHPATQHHFIEDIDEDIVTIHIKSGLEL